MPHGIGRDHWLETSGGKSGRVLSIQGGIKQHTYGQVKKSCYLPVIAGFPFSPCYLLHMT